MAALAVRAFEVLVASVDVETVLVGGMDGLGAQEVGCVWSVGWLGIGGVWCLGACEDVVFGALVFRTCG